jgi:hypothetical protein
METINLILTGLIGILTGLIGIITCIYAALVYNITKTAAKNEVNKAYTRIIVQCDRVRFMLADADKKNSELESKKATRDCYPIMQEMICDYHFIGKNGKISIHLYNSIGYTAIPYFKRDEWAFDDDKTLFGLACEYVQAGIKLLQQTDCEQYLKSHGVPIRSYKLVKTDW